MKSGAAIILFASFELNVTVIVEKSRRKAPQRMVPVANLAVERMDHPDIPLAI
jgi:hypothetical protein